MLKIIQRYFVTAGGADLSKNTNIFRQGKIMNKLFGDRLSGSKKRWIPSGDEFSEKSSSIFKSSLFAHPKQNKQTLRRIVVLNKLFMNHISDFLGSGDISQVLLGYSLQITRVKVSPDFAFVNVWWRGSGDVTQDSELEIELKRCSGILRHKLSQLRLMGEVPIIKFVRDKTYSNLKLVEGLLKNAIDERLAEDTERIPLSDFQKSEFYGIETSSLTKKIKTATDNKEVALEGLPKMRHDVLGLDHRDMAMKILNKMRKSKQAWEQHYDVTMNKKQNENDNQMSLTDKITQLIEQSNTTKSYNENTTNTDHQEFDKYLSKQKANKFMRKNKQRNRDTENLNALNDDNDYEDGLLSPQQLKLFNERDYIDEDDDHKNK